MRKDILNAIKDLKGVKKMINKSELARRFGCSINTVNKYLEIQNTDEKVKRKYSSKLDEYKGIIIEKVDDFSANGRAIYNFIKEKGYTGSYGIVSKFIKKKKKEEFEFLKIPCFFGGYKKFRLLPQKANAKKFHFCNSNVSAISWGANRAQWILNLHV